MTKNMLLPIFTTNQVLNHKPLSPELQQEQAIRLQPFYQRLMSTAFNDSSTAIEHCRDLCAEYGFTVKQEASTHRNIYVYCSREGLADSLRNPKTNPQRRRPSKRCDCRWRVVLFETNGHWEFRKSLNPEASKHNHTLMNPNEIERSWPKEVTHYIFALARQRLTTQEVRTRVQAQFPSIHWNERRFYNRLSEERQKIKLRDSVERTHQLNSIWSRLCMVAAGNGDISKIVEQQLTLLFQSVCETVQVDPRTLPVATMNNDVNKKSKPETRKGYLAVEVPSQIYHVKIHNQRQLQETHILRNQKRQRTYSEESTLELPNQCPKINSGHSSPSSIKSPNMYSMSAATLNSSNISSQSLPPPSSSPSSSISIQPSTLPQQQQQQHPFVYSYCHPLTLDSIQSYVPSFPGNTTTTTSTTGTAHFSMASTPTDTTSSTVSNTNEFNSQDISFAFNTSSSSSSSLIDNASSSSSPLYPGIDIKSKPGSAPSSPNDLLHHPHSDFYASLQDRSDSTSSLQLPMTQNYGPKAPTTKSPVMNNESYQRQMMFIPSTKPF